MPVPPVDVPRKGPIEQEVRKDENGKYTGEEAFLNTLDLEAFRKDIRALGKKLESEQGEADMQHLKKIIDFSNLCGVVGLATMFTDPNPITVLALSLWTYSRWTMIAHHTCHGGYTKEDETGRFNRGKFAIGNLQRRMFDWFDWMLPEAWNLEHNNLHHYNLGEDADPDLVERNLAHVRQNNWPQPLKTAYVLALISVWKWVYYAPNTYKALKVEEMRKKGMEIPEYADKPLVLMHYFNKDEQPQSNLVPPGELITKVMGPYLLAHFFLLPAPLALISGTAFWHGVANLILADILTNIHGFITIVPNHTGKDLYRFTTPAAPNSGEFYLRQVLSSANFNLGNDVVDFWHGWLNYQIEHHIWPNLSMLSYQKGQKGVEAICKKHGVPYIKENVFERTRKTLDIMTGAESMRVFPAEWSIEQEAKRKAAAAASKPAE
eukprot:CAMPEP_0167781110 /NCGR_PEP_ID=MMETSP0111_2-20121227/5744_1 /TAXON_ID=91324 /ORGANISM="Lotharella globosa, Strain CCCM811" /LENGTH=434 /DNA_ID=CAMNT_0007671723 /DNA_START=78 /DNA_END=1382 /DNA_ORIENTATION=-